ncbi:MAG TPA: O-antigen ligase family protein [Marmoricola sp.]
MDVRTRVGAWLLVGSALAVVPGGFDTFALPKLAVAALAIAVVLAAPGGGRLPVPVVGLLAAGVVIGVVVAIVHPGVAASLVGRWPRYEGLPTAAVYASALIAGARSVTSGQSARDLLEFPFVALSGVCAVAAVFDLAGHDLLGFEGHRIGGFLGNASDLGMLMALVFAVLAGWQLVERTGVGAVGAALALFVVATTGSRAAYLAVVAVVAVLALSGARRRVVFAGSGVLVFLAALVAAIPGSRDRILSGHTVEGRELLWGETLRLLRDHPWGVGPSRFVDAIPRYHDWTWIDRVGWQNPPDSAHMWVLQVAVIGGLPLLVAVVAAAVLGAQEAVRSAAHDQLRWALIAGVVAYGVGLLTHFTGPGTTPIAAFVAGAACTRAAVQESRTPATATRARRLPVLGVTVMAVIALGAGLGAVGERSWQRGVDLAAAGDIPAADAAFVRARRWLPWDADLPGIAAQSFAGAASSGDDAAAKATLRWADRALERTPRSAPTLTARAVAAITLRDGVAAQRDLDRALAIDPWDPRTWIQVGVVRAASGDFDGAERALARALRIDPGNAQAAGLLRQVRGLAAE